MATRNRLWMQNWNHRFSHASEPRVRNNRKGPRHAVISMNRPLRFSLDKFIRRGAMTVTTASGESFTCGDGTGEPVAIRFLTHEAERRILLNPELALGEAYMDGSFVVEQGNIADALGILFDQPDILPSLAKVRWWARFLIRHAKQFNPRRR